MKKLLIVLCTSVLLLFPSVGKTQSFLAVNNVLCFGDSSGCILIDTTFSFPWGTAPYSYQIGPNISSYQNGSFCGLSAGAYTITVADSNNIVNNYPAIVSEPTALQITNINKTNVSCNGGSDGSISILAQGGSGSLSYSIVPPSIQLPVGTFTGLPAALYNLTVTDINNCSVDTAITIAEPTALQITNITSTTPSCVPGNDGTMTITAIGGNGTLQYGLPPLVPYQTSNGLLGLSGGSYLASVQDANGCIDTISHSIVNSSTPAWASHISSNVSCHGATDGTILASAVGGTGTITYILIPNSAGPNATGQFSNLAAGAYTISATDANNCSVITIANVTEPAQLSLDTASVLHPTCGINNNGTISLSAQGGTAGYTYTISPSIGSQQLAGNFTGLTSGTYIATVTDANACTATTVVTLNKVSGIVVSSFTHTTPTCQGDSNGTISVSAIGSGPMSYSITIPSWAVTTSSTGQFTNLPSGTYTIIINDTNNCPVVKEVYIEPGGVFIQSASTSHTNCLNNSGSIQANGFSYNTGPISYTLSPFGTQLPAGTFNNLPNGTFTITASDANGCTATTVVTLNYPSKPQITNISTTDLSCYNSYDGSINFGAVGGSSPYTFGLNSTSSFPPYNGLAGGVYYISVTDSLGCSDDATVSLNEPPRMTLSKQTFNTKCDVATDGAVFVNVNGGIVPYTYRSGSLSNSTGSFLNLGVGLYTFVVTDSNNCVDSISHNMIAYSVNLATVFKKNESCVPGTDGEIVIQGYPIDSTYLYSIDSLNWSTTRTFNQLEKGNYTFFLKDSSEGCTAKLLDTLDFTNNVPLNEVVVLGEKCFKKNNGQIIAPNKQYTYSLLPAAGVSSSPGVISNIPPGLYTLIGEKANGCKGEKVIEISAADSLWISSLETGTSNIHCYGTIDFEVIGGASNYQYSIAPKRGRQSSPGYFDGLCWGDYQLTATDSLGCLISEKVSVLEDLNAPSNMFHHFNVYPNPANNEIWLRSSYLFKYEVSLISTIGQCVMKKNVHDKLSSLNVGKLAPGIYIIRFTSEVDHLDRMIVIQH